MVGWSSSSCWSIQRKAGGHGKCRQEAGRSGSGRFKADLTQVREVPGTATPQGGSNGG